MRRVIPALCVLATLCSAALSQIPQLINYQGVLTVPLGNPLSGNHLMRFKMYGSETGGAPLWSETKQVAVLKVTFNVLLGSDILIPISVFDGDQIYFALQVGDDPEMTPRKRIVSIAINIKEITTGDDLKSTSYSAEG
jgi:hypothetical protein